MGLGTGASAYGQTAILAAPEWAPCKFYLISNGVLFHEILKEIIFFLPIALLQVACLLHEVARNQAPLGWRILCHYPAQRGNGAMVVS